VNKRVFNRTSSNLELCCFDENNFGTVKNLSENGMFITSKNIRFPLESQFEISFPFYSKKLKILVKVNRIIKSNGYYDGIAVELLKPNEKYLTIVNELKRSKQDKK
jgi:hypothetical protein